LQTKSGADKDLIIDQALRELTGIQWNFFKPVGSTRRLLFFYSLMFKNNPIVVISVPERDSGESYAQITSAVRNLADIYGLRVIVDGSPNSIPPTLSATKRETVITVEPMQKQQIESIPEFKILIDFLKSHNLDCPVWKVLGGSPADYLKLKEVIIKKMSLPNTVSDEIVDQVKNHLQNILSSSFNKNVIRSNLTTQQIIKIFRERNVIKIPIAELVNMGLLLEYPNKVFREVMILDGWFVVPSSSAISLIISENVQNDADIAKLSEKLFGST